MGYLTDAYHVAVDYLRGVQSPFVSGIELWGPGMCCKVWWERSSIIRICYVSISVHKQAKSPTELKAVMLCCDTWLSVTTTILITVCIDLILFKRVKLKQHFHVCHRGRYSSTLICSFILSLKWALKFVAVPQTECRSHIFQTWMLVLVLQFLSWQMGLIFFSWNSWQWLLMVINFYWWIWKYSTK